MDMWRLLRPEWYPLSAEIHGGSPSLVGVCVGDHAVVNARLMAAAPLMFNTLIQIRDHLDKAGEASPIPYRIAWDLRAVLDHAAQPVYSAELGINNQSVFFGPGHSQGISRGETK